MRPLLPSIARPECTAAYRCIYIYTHTHGTAACAVPFLPCRSFFSFRAAATDAPRLIRPCAPQGHRGRFLHGFAAAGHPTAFPTLRACFRSGFALIQEQAVSPAQHNPALSFFFFRQRLPPPPPVCRCAAVPLCHRPSSLSPLSAFRPMIVRSGERASAPTKNFCHWLSLLSFSAFVWPRLQDRKQCHGSRTVLIPRSYIRCLMQLCIRDRKSVV